MVYTLSYQMYKCEAGLSAAEQRGPDVRAGEGAAAVRQVRVSPGRLSRPRPRGAPSGDGPAGDGTRGRVDAAAVERTVRG